MYTIPPEFTCVTWRILLIRSAFSQLLISFSTSISLPLNMVIFIVERFWRTATATAIPARLKRDDARRQMPLAANDGHCRNQLTGKSQFCVCQQPLNTTDLRWLSTSLPAATRLIKSLESPRRVLRLRQGFGRLVSNPIADAYEATSHFCVLRGFPLQLCVSFRALDRTH